MFRYKEQHKRTNKDSKNVMIDYNVKSPNALPPLELKMYINKDFLVSGDTAILTIEKTNTDDKRVIEIVINNSDVVVFDKNVFLISDTKTDIGFETLRVGSIDVVLMGDNILYDPFVIEVDECHLMWIGFDITPPVEPNDSLMWIGEAYVPTAPTIEKIDNTIVME